jgi:uncharacterized protein YjiS (DUF1127 family)
MDEKPRIRDRRELAEMLEELLDLSRQARAERRATRGRKEFPELLDTAKLARELGVTRAAAEAIMRQVPTVRIPGLRKLYVTRASVVALIERDTQPEAPYGRDVRRGGRR